MIGRVADWADDFMNHLIDKYLGLAVFVITALGALAIIAVIASTLLPASHCAVTLASGERTERRGCRVDVSRAGYMTGVVGKGGMYIPPHDGSGSLVCADMTYAPGAWSSVVCK